MCFTGHCHLMQQWESHHFLEVENVANEAAHLHQVLDPYLDVHHPLIAPRPMDLKVCANLNRRGVKMLLILSCDLF